LFDPRLQPTASRLGSGIVFLKDTAPVPSAAGDDGAAAAEARDKVELRLLRSPATSDEAATAPAPEVFEWVVGEYF